MRLEKADLSALVDFCARLNKTLKSKEFDLLDGLLIGICVNSVKVKKNYFEMSLQEFSKLLLSSTATVSRHLRKLANYKLINVYHQYDKDHKVRLHSMIEVSPLLLCWFYNDYSKVKDLKLIETFAGKGKQRLETYKDYVKQGFFSDVDFGSYELVRCEVKK